MTDFSARQKILAKLGPEWVVENVTPVELRGKVGWRPDAVTREGRRLLHIQLISPLKEYARKRMRAAIESGFSVCVALPAYCMLQDGTLEFLVVNEVDVLVLQDDHEIEFQGSAVKFLVESNILVEGRLRRSIAEHLWTKCRDAEDNNKKGLALELLVGFLFSQIAELQVVETNLRTDTEELDIVVQNRDFSSGRCWASAGAQMLLVEAKNWSGKVGQPEVSVLITKIRGKRGFIRIGVLIGAGGFTSDAKRQALKFSSEQMVICFVERSTIEGWIQADDYSEYFECLLRRDILA